MGRTRHLKSRIPRMSSRWFTT